MVERSGRGRGIPGRRILQAACLSAGALCGTAALAQTGPGAGNYAFEAPPSAQANRVYSVNRQTGEVSACQFERPDSALVGITRCFPKGEGAGAQKAGVYSLVSARFAGETGIFRVNADTGEMSVCYVRDVPKSGGGGAEPMVLCTPQAK
ncbi:hypothetical protein [Roseixanthobacter pseudopolyaromaticivorans]|uniref:hypothetical protein n=1 Tax=Xanthobacteraceae TaxID=335928 RepID=UPI003727E846